MVDFDSGIAILPAVRPSVFSPAAAGTTVPAPNASVDSGVATTPASRVNTFDDLADAQIPTTPDPGDVLAG